MDTFYGYWEMRRVVQAFGYRIDPVIDGPAWEEARNGSLYHAGMVLAYYGIEVRS